MARQHVFLVHGMGEQEKGSWHKPFVDALIGAVRYYHPFSEMSPQEVEQHYLKFIPVSYDDIFNEYRERWTGMTGGVAATLASTNPELGDAFLAFSESANGEGAARFFWTHLLDPLLWYLFPQAREAVVSRVTTQLIDGIAEMNAEGSVDSAHLLAHSLGTSVAHDSLVALCHWKGDKTVFDPDKHVWQTVGMIANVGRLLEATFTVDQSVDVSAFKVYSSALKPGGQGSVCRNYLNAHHAIDPFTWPRRFKPADWPTYGYSDIEVTRVRRLTQVHDFDHYMKDPAVHVAVLSLILKRADNMCTAEEVRRAYDDFNAEFHPCQPTEFAEIREIFGGDSDKKLSLRELVKFLYKTFKELRQ